MDRSIAAVSRHSHAPSSTDLRHVIPEIHGTIKDGSPALGSATSVDNVHDIDQADDASIRLANWQSQEVVVVHGLQGIKYGGVGKHGFGIGSHDTGDKCRIK